MDADFNGWIDDSAVWLEPETYAVEPDQRERLALIDSQLDDARIVLLGETNHFIHEKGHFRLWWLKRLAARKRLVIGEELGWSDGRRVASYLADGDESHINTAAIFGYKEHLRTDRDDSPTGVFANANYTYPYELMKAEHSRFYRALRDLQVVDDYFGFDIDSPPGGAYEDIAGRRPELDRAGMPEQFWTDLARVQGESVGAETRRLRTLMEMFASAPGFELVREDLLSLIESLEYTALVKDAADYEATRPAMAYREQSMKRRIDDVLRRTDGESLIVLMGHAFHLAKDDRRIEGQGVGPGGGKVSSLGHYLTQERGLETASVWMIYGKGEDSQPLADLPRNANYPDDTLNSLLGAYGKPMVFPIGNGCPLGGSSQVGHLYNLVVPVDICMQTDAIMFFPTISPLVGD